MRHPTFGDYSPIHIADDYFTGGLMGPDVSPFEQIDHAFWLLSIASSWLPKSTHAVLLKGMKELKSWLWQDLGIENPMR